MLTRRLALAAPFSLLPLVGRAAEGPPLVVASMTILQDMAVQVAGDLVRTISLVPPDGDPHAFEPRPGDLVALRGAAAMVENGLGLEGWLTRLVPASGFKGVRIVASAGIKPRSLVEDGARVSDPHIWQDPGLGRAMVQTIAAGLARAVPGAAGRIMAGAARYSAALAQAEAEIEAALAPIPAARRRVLTTHDAFGYYGARFGVTFIAIEGISTDAEPSPRALGRIAALAKKERIGTVFLENMTDPRLAEALAREAHLAVGPKLYADSLSPAGGPAATYLALLHYNTQQFVTAMTA